MTSLPTRAIEVATDELIDAVRESVRMHREADLLVNAARRRLEQAIEASFEAAAAAPHAEPKGPAYRAGEGS